MTTKSKWIAVVIWLAGGAFIYFIGISLYQASQMM